MSDRGRYVVIEGDNASGKSTQMKLLQAQLTDCEVKFYVVREPGGEPFAEKLRDALKSKELEITPIAQLLGFCSARANLLELVVKPQLEAGFWALSDRSYVSSIVYQGLANGLGKDPLFSPTLEYSIKPAKPDLVVVLDVPFEVAQERIGSREGREIDRYESAGDKYRRTINNGYREVGLQEPFKLIDGDRSEEEVHQSIWALVEPMIKEVRK